MIKASTGIFCLLAVLLVTPAVAQSGPTIRLVSPSTAGGGSDTLARLLADQISRKQGRTVVVENRPHIPKGFKPIFDVDNDEEPVPPQ